MASSSSASGSTPKKYTCNTEVRMTFPRDDPKYVHKCTITLTEIEGKIGISIDPEFNETVKDKDGKDRKLRWKGGKYSKGEVCGTILPNNPSYIQIETRKAFGHEFLFDFKCNTSDQAIELNKFLG